MVTQPQIRQNGQPFARIGLTLFGSIVTAIGVYFFWADSPIYGPVVRAIWHLPPPYRVTMLSVAVVAILIGLEALLALGGLSIASAILPLLTKNAAQTRAIRVYGGKKIVQIALVDGADLIAMCLESGPVAARRKLLGEFVRSLDYAVSICGDRPIWLATDAIKESTALRIGLRPRRLGIVYQFGYALTMSPMLTVLRAFTKGRGYKLCAWTLDREAYVEFRKDPRTAKIVDPGA